MFGDDKSQPTTKFFTGILIILMAAAGLVELVRNASDSITPGATPSGFWWSLVALLGVFPATRYRLGGRRDQGTVFADIAGVPDDGPNQPIRALYPDPLRVSGERAAYPSSST